MIVFLLILIVLIGVVAGVAQSVRNHTRLEREAKEQNLYGAIDRSDVHSFVRRSPSRPAIHQCDAFGLRFALFTDRKTAYLLYSTKERLPSQGVIDLPPGASIDVLCRVQRRRRQIPGASAVDALQIGLLNVVDFRLDFHKGP